MKKHLLTIALLLTPISTLLAQENRHAQAMHTAFVETINGKFPKNIKAKLESMNEDSATVARGEWGCLDGGGLVPKEKIHVVTLSKSKSNVAAAIGPLYIDGHRFSFNQVPDDPTLPLRPILDAFDKQSPYANSYYSYKAGDEQTTFPGVRIAWGEQGQTFPLELHPSMNVRIIGFKDDDGFRSTFLLSWLDTELTDGDSIHKRYMVEGIIYEFHCPKIDSAPQVKSYDPDEYLNRTNTGLGVAHNLVWAIKNDTPERARALETDTVMEKFSYTFQNMVTKLYNNPETPNLRTSYEALKSKLQRMVDLIRTASETESQAICHTLNKEVNSYPFLLSPHQVMELSRMVEDIGNAVPQELASQVGSAMTIISSLWNYTTDIDSLNDQDQAFLNCNYWKVNHHLENYTHVSLTSHGEHYTGDSQKYYFEVDSVWMSHGFHAENSLQNLRPGRYRISAVVRAEKTESRHSGVRIFARSGEGGHGNEDQQEIPAEGETGGNVWFSALCRFEQRAADKKSVYTLDIDKATANGGQGFGWNRIYIDDIVVKDGTLTYGVSTRPEITNSHQFESSWFSVCDFIVERIDD